MTTPDVYASFNRVIDGSYRNGSGASKVTLFTENPGTHNVELGAGEVVSDINFGNSEPIIFFPSPRRRALFM
ncbi:MAG: hypothetical protein GDA56_25705 [Hormoscilla sp. GM7CHS1pb]|nr:hypothetical protein [Hormoscilla sp. GM7CHS1pb]